MQTLIIICFFEKKIFLRFCLCIFESGTVKSDCPVQIFRKIMKYLKIFSGDIKKKLWKWPVNWSFSELFYLFFCPPPPTLNLKKNPVNQLIKNSGLIRKKSSCNRANINRFQQYPNCFMPPDIILGIIENYYSLSQPKRMLWVLKRTVSMRWFFWATENTCWNWLLRK